MELADWIKALHQDREKDSIRARASTRAWVMSTFGPYVHVIDADGFVLATAPSASWRFGSTPCDVELVFVAAHTGVGFTCISEHNVLAVPTNPTPVVTGDRITLSVRRPGCV